MKAWPNSGGLKTGSVATIYFAQRGPYVKIGISRDPIKRIRRLRHANRCITPADADRREPIRLIHLVPDSTLDDEFAMQARFADWHEAGEWFRYDAAFVATLAAYITGIADDALARADVPDPRAGRAGRRRLARHDQAGDRQGRAPGQAHRGRGRRQVPHRPRGSGGLVRRAG